MLGLMQDYPLNIHKLLEYSEQNNASEEIVSKRLEGDVHRYTYKDLGRRSRQLASALKKAGVEPGDVAGTIAWNGYRHVELYFALPGIGALYHTINPRLTDEQLAYVINHADDTMVFIEASFVERLEAIGSSLKSIKMIVVLCDEADLPSSENLPLVSYEAFIATGDPAYQWQEFDEKTACAICYTSGTTGNPKGVVYSHRALILQAFSFIIGAELTCRDVFLPVVPMFHVNGWTIPFMCAMLGAKLVLPGKDLDAASLHEIMKAEGVTFAAGVPTVWQQLLGYLNENDLLLPDLKRVMVGGSAAPRIMIETFKDGYDIDVMHAWGMTETTSMGTSPSLSAKVVRQGADSMLTAKMMQGRSYFGLEMKLMDDAGNELPKDGEASGHLYIRGWAVASEYLGAGKTEEFTEDGWFSTGDIATLTPDGYLRLTDRAKDLIKSGGEWISSIDLENAAMAHPSIKQAAVIAIPHPKWDERPLLIAVPEGAPPSKSELLKFLSRSVAKWWLPDEVVFQAELPLGATGKVDKKLLRENYWA